MQLNERALSSYLSARLDETVEVKTLAQSFPGISRETWFVTADVAGTERGFVFRFDPPEGGSCPYSLRTEWEVYRKLYGTEVPVAEPLWFEEHSDLTQGRALMVRRLVDGRSTIAGLYDNSATAAELRRRVAFECIENLARVHKLDWRAAGFAELMAAPASPEVAFKSEFELWKGYWEQGRPFPDPVLDEVMVWMGDHIPSDTPFVSLVKGNNGIGEEIWRDGRIVAMSDWELACLGDGISDLFWSQGTVRLIGFDHALSHYERCTGQIVSIERLTFAGLFALLKQVICAVVFWYGHLHAGRTKRIYALSALTYTIASRYKLGCCIGKSLADAWAIIGGSEKSMYTTVEAGKK